MASMKNEITTLLIIILLSFDIITAEQNVVNDKQPTKIQKDLLQNGHFISNNQATSEHNSKNHRKDYERFNEVNDENINISWSVDDNDEEDNNESDEIMKTSEQIAFRPLFRRYVPAVIFRHKQMLEERQKRKEMRRRNSLEESERQNANQRRTGANYNRNNEIYICYGQNCRPITAYDIRRLQLLQPTTQFYQQRNRPEGYYNEYSFRRPTK